MTFFRFTALAWIGLPIVAGAAEPFTLQSLKSLVSKTRARTVEQVIEHLPPELKQETTFVAKSTSFQQSSPGSPRVISWSVPGAFALAWGSGDPKHFGHDTIEGFQYTRGRFVYFELKFVDGKPLFSRPTSCAGCHGSGTHARPVWEEYPTWSDAFGSQDDFMPEQERAEFLSFKKSAHAHNRYRWLMAPKFAPSDAYLEYPFRQNDHRGMHNPATGFAQRPNSRLGIFLNRLNARRLATRFAKLETPRLERFLGSVMGCEGAPALGDTLNEVSLSARDLDLRKKYLDEENEKLDVMLSYTDGSATIRELLAARLLEILSKRGARFELDRLTRTFAEKYSADTEVTRLDRPLMEQWDRLGSWVPLPYEPSALTAAQKREPFRASFGLKYQEICRSLGLKGRVR